MNAISLLGRLDRSKALAAGLLLAAATLASAQPGPGGWQGGHGRGGHEEGGRGMPHARMLDSVGATADQKAQIRQIVQTAQAELKPQRDAQRALRQQMQALMAASSVDANAVENVRQRLSQGQDSISRRMTQAMVEAGRVLTPEQRRQLQDKMAQRRAMGERHHAERQALDGAPARKP